MFYSNYFLPDLLEIQREGFFYLLEKGIIEEIQKRNPITNSEKQIEIFFYPEYYRLTKPFYSIEQAIFFQKSYVSKFYVPVQFTDRKKKRIFLKWMLLAHFPLMTNRGHFVLNGSPRVILHQLVRSPGIYFRENLHEVYSSKWSEKPTTTFRRFYADIICLKGTWLRIESEKDFSMWVKMKKGPKIPLLWFLLGMGLSEKYILNSVSKPTNLFESFTKEIEKLQKSNFLKEPKYPYISTPKQAWEKIQKLLKLKKTLSKSVVLVSSNKTRGHSFSVNEEEQSSFLQFSKSFGTKCSYKDRIEKEVNQTMSSLSKSDVFLFSTDTSNSEIVNEKGKNVEERNQSISKKMKEQTIALKNKEEKKRKLKNSEKTKNSLKEYGTEKKALQKIESFDLGRRWFFNRFMNPRMYDLGKQGRLSINKKLGLTIPSDLTTLTAFDVLFATDYLMKMQDGLFEVDDIDHLKNKRVRSSGECLQEIFSLGVFRLEKSIRLKLNSHENQNVVFSTKNSPRSLNLERTSSISSLTSNAIPTPSLKGKGKQKEGVLQASVGTTVSLPTAGNSSFQNESMPKSFLKETRKIDGGKRASFFQLQSFINTRPINGAFREFFGTHPLSQFMDQMNPLAEITHKRRLTSLGPGGVSRDTATLAIRGIHPSHYGRICPIETPEGKNTGLVNSITTYAKLSFEGFLKSPYYKISKGQIQRHSGVFFLDPEQEERFRIATPDLKFTRLSFLPKSSIPVRIGKRFVRMKPRSLSLIGVSPLQMISVATSFIPFLEHDDANRALMGSNMQRQAVPLLRPERPFLGTGLEARVLHDSGHALFAETSGYVLHSSGSKILVYTFKN